MAGEQRWIAAVFRDDMLNWVAYTDPFTRQDLSVFAADRMIFVRRSPQGLEAVAYRLVEPEKTRVYKVIIGSRQDRPGSMTVGENAQEQDHFLMRFSLPLQEYLALPAADRQGIFDRGEESCLSRSAASGSLRFTYSVLRKEGGNTTALRSESVAAGDVLRGVELRAVLRGGSGRGSGTLQGVEMRSEFFVLQGGGKAAGDAQP